MKSIILSLFKISVLFLFFNCTQKKVEQRNLSAIKPERPFNVCYITINSDDEKKILNQRLSSENFTHQELATQTDWLKKSCESSKKCDVVVISGHYAGRFFGQSGYSLNPKELLKLRCEKKCQGLIDEPTEVYLLGCNTLSGTKADARTPEEYYNVLIQDGYRPEVAANVVAARYGQIGKTNRSLFENIFAKSPHIYGFYSIGPSGKTMKPYLNKYLDQQSPYENWLQSAIEQKQSKSYSGLNTKLKTAWSDMYYTESAGTLSGNSKSLNGENSDSTLDFFCSFLDENKNSDEKLKIISDLFLNDNENYRFYIDELVEFFHKNPIHSFKNMESKLILSKIKNKIQLKNQFIEIIEQSSFFPIKVKVLALAKSLDILETSDVQKQMKSIVLPLLQDSEKTVYWSNILCSLSESLTDPISEIIKYDHFSNKLNHDKTLTTLKCLKPKDSQLLVALVNQFSHPDQKIAQLSEELVYSVKSKNRDVLKSIVSATAKSNTHREVYLRNYFYHLINNDQLDLEFYNFILDQAATAEKSIQTQMISLFRYNNPTDKNIIKRLKKEFQFSK